MNKFAVAILAFASVAHAGAPLSYSTGVISQGIASPVAYAQPQLAYAAQPQLIRQVAQQVAYAQPQLLRAPVAVAQPVLRQQVAYAQPIAKAVAVAPEPFDPHPQYNYGYSVSDALTGDQKSQTESRDGDVVQGQYSLVEPDGAIRTVTYTADAINGFNAVVSRQAPAVVQKAVVAQPQLIRAAPQIAYAQPQQLLRAAPQVAYAQQGLVGRTILG